MPQIIFKPSQKPEIYDFHRIYNKDLHENDPGEFIVPEVRSLLVDTADGIKVYVVTAVGPAPDYKTFYKPIPLINLDQNFSDQRSYVDYGNDKLFLYIDDRNNPSRCNVDGKILIPGNPRVYSVVRYPDTPDEKVISMTASDNIIPMHQLKDNDGNLLNLCMFEGGLLSETPEINERLRLDVYSEDGVITSRVYVFSARSNIINESIGYTPVIVDIVFEATQQDPDGTIWLMTRQNASRLNLRAYLIYSDGTRRLANIDGTKASFLGLDYITSSYPGQSQSVVFKYALEKREVTTMSIDRYISKSVDIQVREESVDDIYPYIASYPYYSNNLGKYQISHVLYTSDKTPGVDVTNHVTYLRNKPFVGDLYGTYQDLLMEIDLNQAMPDKFLKDNDVRIQSVSIRLHPVTHKERYWIKESSETPVVYGVDSPSSRRPVLFYDESIQKYYIPSSIFRTKEEFLYSSYNKFPGPYDKGIQVNPETPTHFFVRDVVTGDALIPQPIPLDIYETAFPELSNIAGSMVGKTVVVEFLISLNATQFLTLSGVPVDVYKLGDYT